MVEKMIKLSSVDDVRRFTNVLTEKNLKVSLTNGRYTVDGRSIMGIFCLNLSQPLKLISESDECEEELYKAIGDFINN